MTESEKKFLQDNFKAGEYVACTILVTKADFQKFVDHLKAANLTLAILPSVETKAEFELQDEPGKQVVS